MRYRTSLLLAGLMAMHSFAAVAETKAPADKAPKKSTSTAVAPYDKELAEVREAVEKTTAFT